MRGGTLIKRRLVFPLATSASAADRDVDVGRIDLEGPRPAPGLLRGDDRRTGAGEGIEHQIAPRRDVEDGVAPVSGDHAIGGIREATASGQCGGARSGAFSVAGRMDRRHERRIGGQ